MLLQVVAQHTDRGLQGQMLFSVYFDSSTIPLKMEINLYLNAIFYSKLQSKISF